MFDNARMLDLIERAIDDDPFCPACGATTTIAEHDGRLWLVCSAALEPTTVIARVSAAVMPHTRRLVVDLSEHIAA